MSMLMSARGVGALTGPLVATKWAGGSASRMRTGILVAFLAGAVGYMLLSFAPDFSAGLRSNCGGPRWWLDGLGLLDDAAPA